MTNSPAAPSLIVYGASDDLVEVDGSASIEVGVYGMGSIPVLVNCEPVLSLSLNGEGMWAITLEKNLPELTIQVIPAIGDDGGTHEGVDVPDYSDYAIVTGSIRSVQVMDEAVNISE